MLMMMCISPSSPSLCVPVLGDWVPIGIIIPLVSFSSTSSLSGQYRFPGGVSETAITYSEIGVRLTSPLSYCCCCCIYYSITIPLVSSSPPPSSSSSSYISPCPSSTGIGGGGGDTTMMVAFELFPLSV